MKLTSAYYPFFPKLFISIILLSVAMAVYGQTSVNKIEGYVLDRDNRPLAGVLIRLYRGTNILPNTQRTTADGSYSVSFESGEPITTLRYDLTNWYPSIVENISGVRDHRINKVLRNTSVALSAEEIREYGSLFDKLLALDVANGTSYEKYREEYKAVLDVWANQKSISNPVLAQNDKIKPLNFRNFYTDYDYYERNFNSVGAKNYLFKITNAQAARIGNNSIQIKLEVEAVSSGWRIATFQYKNEKTLHVFVTGQPPSTPLSKAPAAYTISETYDDVADISSVIFHGTQGEVKVNLAKSP